MQMNEPEFFEKHPSYLKYKKIMMLTSTEMDAIDDTQIDKAIVMKALKGARDLLGPFSPAIILIEKELELE